jgi:hypothetical protein
MRVAHFLKSNKSKAFPTRIVAFDCETSATPLTSYRARHDLRLGVACYWHRRGQNESDTYNWFSFDNPDSFWNWLVSHVHNKTRLVVTSHNLSFDLSILGAFAHLPERGFELTGYYCKGLTTLIRFKSKRGNLDFVDNTNFFPGSLASLSNLVDLPKLQVDFDNVSDTDLEVYCHRDVEILVALWQQWLAFLQEHDLGHWCRTLPSQAFAAYRHRFMRYKILIHDHQKALHLERASYHGGRTEVLQVGKFADGPYYKLDVNSMYSYVMESKAYPCVLYGYRENPRLEYLINRLERHSVIADCEICTNHPAFPHPVAGHTTYPVGTFRTVLTTPELKYILAYGQVLKCYALAFYRSEHIFTDYVRYFYPLKRQYHESGNKPYRTIVKGFLNFLYGKFGQRGLSDTIVGQCSVSDTQIISCVDEKTRERYNLIHLGGQVIRRQSQDESYNSFPAIAAHVTAYARMYLFSLLSLAGRENTLYMDTDSLIVNQAGYDNLRHTLNDSRLGALKLEGISAVVTIRAPKDYTFADHTYIKGIRSSAEVLGPNHYLQDKFPSIAGLLRKGDLSQYVVERVEKHLQRRIYSGLVDPTGTVRPFVLPLPSPSPSAIASPPQ